MFPSLLLSSSLLVFVVVIDKYRCPNVVVDNHSLSLPVVFVVAKEGRCLRHVEVALLQPSMLGGGAPF
jgi:hypothetical protein